MADTREREISAENVLYFLSDTSQLLSQENTKILASVAASYTSDNVLTGNVEFWKWMDQNYSGANGHMFSSNSAMREYISGGRGKEEWIRKQLQGKGYEWDWMQKQRNNIHNLFKRYDAGTISNQPGYDVLEQNLLTGTEMKYQMKAYTGKSNPNLHNTDLDIKVVTNTEKVDIVSRQGYEVEGYKSAGQIKENTNQRMEQIKKGSASPGYNVKNVIATVGKAGMIGAATGITIESISLYKDWKEGVISNQVYVNEILKAGGDAGLTASATAGIMIPVTARVAALGLASPVTIPVAFVISAAVNKVVAPCFARGEYKNILNQAKYYQSLEGVYNAFIGTVEITSMEYLSYITQIRDQALQHELMKKRSMDLNKKLKSIYDSI